MIFVHWIYKAILLLFYQKLNSLTSQNGTLQQQQPNQEQQQAEQCNVGENPLAQIGKNYVKYLWIIPISK